MRNLALLKPLQYYKMGEAEAKQSQHHSKRLQPQSEAGFTLIEMIVVVIIIGVLSAIAAPGWLAFVNRQRVNKFNDSVLSVLQTAQTEAKRKKLSQTVQFKTDTSTQQPQVSVYDPNQIPSSLSWKPLSQNTDIKPGQIILSTPSASTSNSVTFDYQGNVKSADIRDSSGAVTSTPTTPSGGSLFAVTVSVPNTQTKRCVLVQTLIGTMRIPEDPSTCP